jgi:hypothetical protein
VETPYDWLTVSLFAGLIVLFMQRSTSEDNDIHDPLWMYLTAGAGCGVTNYLGNKGMHVLAIVALLATLAFVFHFLKPFSSSKPG